MKQAIREFSGVIIGYIDTASNGDKTVTNYYGKILGYYKKSYDHTTDFYGKILYHGDMAAALLILFK